jgi:aminopeptidase N
VDVIVKTIKPIDLLLLNLNDNYRISSVRWNNVEGENEKLSFEHEKGKIKIYLPDKIESDQTIKVTIHYRGKPTVAKRPPWDDGFVWSKTSTGEDWIGVTCQGGGADIWWPCKDHPSDEPDSLELNITVPNNLICAANGKLFDESNNLNGTKTFNWFVSTPINNYAVSLHIAPYDTIKYNYVSVTKEIIPVTIYALPENLEKARLHSPQFLEHLRFYEELLGPYPFRRDKYAVAETPYLGMEHQTIIANGFGYKNSEDGFDWLHHHELAHEWFGNLVTARDWSDFWIHEGAAAYMQSLYAEKLGGLPAYHNYQQKRMNFENKQPVAPRREMTGGEAYTSDIYVKGSWTLHTLRYYLGKGTLFEILRKWCYPKKELENISDGTQCRFSDTDEFLKIAEEISGKKLDWFWEVYLRQASLPTLIAKQDTSNSTLSLKWEIENNIQFEMPVELKIDEKIIKIEMKNGEAVVKLPQNIIPVIDPNKWILMNPVKIEIN